MVIIMKVTHAINTRYSDQRFLFLRFLPVGASSYERGAFSYTASTVWNKVLENTLDFIHNALSVMSFRKQLKHTILDIFRDHLMVM